MKFTRDNTDYALSIRRIGDIQHAMEVINLDDESTTIVDCAEFLEYCKQTEQIHADSDISRHGAGLVRMPTIIRIWDGGRAEYYEQEKSFSYTIADFMADFVGVGLDEALVNYLNDSKN